MARNNMQMANSGHLIFSKKYVRVIGEYLGKVVS